MGERPYDPMNTGNPSGMEGSGADEPTPETQQIREEIAQTRAELGDTIDEIQERLTPSHLVEQAKEAVRGATMDKVQELTNQAGQTASHLVERTRDSTEALLERIREHPVPVACAGLGLALLFTARRRATRDSDRAHSGPAHVWDRHSNEWPRATVQHASTGRSEDHGMAVTRRDIRRAAEVVRSSASRLQHTIRANPVAIGFAAVAAGVVVGLVLPDSDVEKEYLGDAHDTVFEQAKSVVEEIASQGSAPEGTG